MPFTAALFFVGGLALAGLPPFGTFAGKSLIDDAATATGYGWLPWVIAASGALAGGAVLRAAARIFLGWGPREHDRFISERFGVEPGRESEGGASRTPAAMSVPAVALLACGLALGVWPGLSGRVERGASAFVDRPAYAASVLGGRAVAVRAAPPVSPSAHDAATGVAGAAGAVLVATVGLGRRRLIPPGFRALISHSAGRGFRAFRALHSGHVGDYVAWLTLGIAVLGGSLAVALRG
jgi:multicomponent Na+:H+ antiporter subunit D